MHHSTTYLQAAFDPKLKTYWYLQSLVLFIATIVGIPFVPVWLIIGPAVVRRQFEALSCTLMDDKLVVKRGVWFRSQKTIPLENIQDLSVIEGPLLTKFGLCALRVETAGTGTQPGMADAALTGVVNALEFRDEVFTRRDALRVTAHTARTGAETPLQDGALALLTDIRDSLARIEARLGD